MDEREGWHDSDQMAMANMNMFDPKIHVDSGQNE